jgi:hypothetical protein
MNDPYVKHGIAIINPYGGIWTNEVFDTPEAAYAYLRHFWKGVPTADLTRYQLAMATQIVTLDRPAGDPIFLPLPQPT